MEEDEQEDIQDEEDFRKIEAHAEKEGIVPGYGFPQDTPKDNLYRFWRWVVAIKDSKKTANLSKTEIGLPVASVRGLLGFSLFSEVLGYDKISKFYNDESENILSTSSSSKGFLAQLFATEIRKVQKVKGGEISKKGWFSKKDTGDDKRGGEG